MLARRRRPDESALTIVGPEDGDKRLYAADGKWADDVSMSGHGEDSDAALLDMAGLHRLVEVLIERGYRVVGPTLRDNAIVLAELESAADLPRGWGVDVGPGHYRVRSRDDDAAFGHSAGPQSWKQFLHPPRQRLWAGTRDGASDAQSEEEVPRYAFLGVRGCDLAAIATLDRVLGRSEYPDNSFVSRRRQAFVVAVNCTEPGGLCFCASMGTGPAVGPGYDLALTERLEGDAPSYLVDIGSQEGADVLAAVPHRTAESEEIALRACRCRGRGRSDGPPDAGHGPAKPADPSHASRRSGTRWPVAA